MKCSNWPGRPVRTISCAGTKERTARRTTQHHVRKRSDVVTRLARIMKPSSVGPGDIWWRHVPLVDFSQPVWRCAEPEQHMQPDPAVDHLSRTTLLETPR